MNLILASASPRRRDLLARAGYAFSVVPASIAETVPLNFEDAALVNAVRKAEDVARRHPESLVIGSDTVIEFQHGIFGKPSDLKDAARMLSRFSGTFHTVATGVNIRGISFRINLKFVERTKVFFKSLSESDIQNYLSRVSVLDKAGAYAIQEHSDWIVDRIEGDFDNVVGFPVAAVADSLKILEKLR